MDSSCIEEFYQPDIDNKGGRFDKFTDYQDSIISMANNMANSTETFAEGFKRGFGTPIPLIGGFIDRQNANNTGHGLAIRHGADQGVAGFHEGSFEIAGEEFKVLVDVTNPKAGAIGYTYSDVGSNSSNMSEFMDQHGDAFNREMNRIGSEAISERDNFISRNGMTAYEDSLHDFLNVGLPNGIAGRELMPSNARELCLASLDEGSPLQYANLDTMTSAVGPAALIQLAAAHLDVDEALTNTGEVSPVSPAHGMTMSV